MRLPMYDLRCTIYDLDYSAPEARGGEALAEAVGEIAGVCWFERGNGAWRRLCTIYDLRFTI